MSSPATRRSWPGRRRRGGSRSRRVTAVTAVTARPGSPMTVTQLSRFSVAPATGAGTAICVLPALRPAAVRTAARRYGRRPASAGVDIGEHGLATCLTQHLVGALRQFVDPAESAAVTHISRRHDLVDKHELKAHVRQSSSPLEVPPHRTRPVRPRPRMTRMILIRFWSQTQARWRTSSSWRSGRRPDSHRAGAT